jgi:hypothetical protein
MRLSGRNAPHDQDRRFAEHRRSAGRAMSAAPRRCATWVAVCVAVAAITGVAAIVAGLWSAAGNADISAAGWLALVLGALVALSLGIGLMALVFISSRRGYDDQR